MNSPSRKEKNYRQELTTLTIVQNIDITVNQSRIDDFLRETREINEMNNIEYIDQIRKIGSTRIFYTNSNRFNLSNEEKCDNLLRECVLRNIDIVLLSEKN